MPYDVDIGDGADALGQNQLTDALDGTYWVSGWDATLGTGDLEVDIAAGEGAIDGADVSTASTQTIDFTGDPDSTDPRKAVISVDDTGTVQKTLGTPTPAAPADEIRFRTYDPAPPTNAPGVVVAEVWLAAGETSLVGGDVRDRRVANQAAESLDEFSLVANGYVDQSANRASGTEYTNTTGNPLEVRIDAEATVDDSRLASSMQVDGVTVQRTVYDLSDGTFTDETSHNVNVIVPDGSTYTFFAFSGLEINLWFEQELTVE